MIGRVLLVPDLFYWVTAKIGLGIARVWGQEYEFQMISEPVLQALLKENPQFLDSYSIIHCLTPHIATRLKGFILPPTKLVVTIHHVEDERSVEPMSYADAIMTVCSQWDRYLRVHYPQRSDAIYIARNAVDINTFSPVSSRRKSSLRRRYGIPQAKFVVGFSCKRTSNSCDRKGLDLLERLIKCSELADAGVHWLVRGPGWNDFISRLAATNITYLPFEIGDVNLACSYQAMDAYVITSRIEGGPVPLIEAMSCGLVTLTTPVGIAREVVKHSANGFLVPFGDDRKVRNTLIALISDQKRRASIGIAARQLIMQKYTWDSTLVNIERLYFSALGGACSEPRSRNCISMKGPGIASSSHQLVPYRAREELAFAEFLRNENATRAALSYYLRALGSSIHCGPKPFVKTGYHVGMAIMDVLKRKIRGTKIVSSSLSAIFLLRSRG